jgi:2,3-dihydroxybiphenyl 1,2-dioxygenase
MMALSVKQLGYVALNVSDLAAWRRLGSEFLGFETTEADGALYFRIDERPYRIALFPSSSDGIAYSGWEAADAEEYRQLIDRLDRAGVALVEGRPEQCAARNVEAFVSFTDPGGFAVELYRAPRRDPRQLRQAHRTSGFKAGEMGLGHIVLHYKDKDEPVRFYCDLLGFRVSDTAQLKNTDAKATFLHCNARHHSLAIIGGVPGRAGAISHLMVEVNAMEDVGRAYELCQSKGFPISLSLGQHTNDRMLSFYVQTPSGFALEYGYGGIEIDDADWEVVHWETASYWGHVKNAPS